MKQLPEPFIGIHEAARLTGYNPKYIGQLCRAGKIPFHRARPGARLHFLVSELRAWLRGDWERAQ